MQINQILTTMVINLSYSEASRLASILANYRHSLSIHAESMTWRNVGDSCTSYTIDDIVFMEDVRAQLIAATEEDEQLSHFAGCCKVF